MWILVGSDEAVGPFPTQAQAEQAAALSGGRYQGYLPRQVDKPDPHALPDYDYGLVLAALSIRDYSARQ